MPPKANPAKVQGRKRSSNEHQPATANAAHPSTDTAQTTSDQGSEQTPSSSDAAAPVIKKAKLAPAAAAAASSSAAAATSTGSSSSAAASASASSAPTPCGRLDADSLSVVYSFLNMQDFLRAVRVSRHWRAARVKKSAWPAFSLQTMIQSLRDDDFDSPQRRKLNVCIPFGLQNRLSGLVGQAGMMDLWRHVTEIKVWYACKTMRPVSAQSKQIPVSIAVMQLIPQFASLAALTLDGFALAPDADDPAIQLFDALSARLLMLGLFRCGREYERQLHRLSSLRVLVLGWIPVAESLLQLHQLVYLHIQHERGWLQVTETARLGYVIRWLSVHHQLRSFSIEGVESAQACLHALMSTEAAADQDAELFALNSGFDPQLDHSVPCALTDLSVQYIEPAEVTLLDSVPSLTRLQASILSQHGGIHPARQLQLTLPRLQQLQLQGDEYFTDWHELVHCSALRVVRLSQYRPWRYRRDLIRLSQATLQSLFSAWSPTLEECFLDLKLELDAEEPQSGNNPWPQLAACHRLRILELRLAKGQALPTGLVAALQHLPTFQSLALSFEGAAVCPLSPNLLSVMAQSHSFSTLHLHALSAGSRSPDFVQSAEIANGRGLSAMLSVIAEREPALLTAQTISRLRVVGHRIVNGASREHSYRVVLTDDQPKWHREH